MNLYFLVFRFGGVVYEGFVLLFVRMCIVHIFKVIMGGGANRLMDSSRGGKRRDGLNVDLEWEKLGGKRKILRTGKDLREYNASRGEKVLGRSLTIPLRFDPRCRSPRVGFCNY